MSDTTTIINSAMAEIIESAISVKQFVVSETPLVIEELLHWKILENGLDVLIGVLMVIIAAYSVFKLNKVDPQGELAMEK
jgi:hypothetical protein